MNIIRYQPPIPGPDSAQGLELQDDESHRTSSHYFATATLVRTSIDDGVVLYRTCPDAIYKRLLLGLRKVLTYPFPISSLTLCEGRKLQLRPFYGSEEL